MLAGMRQRRSTHLQMPRVAEKIWQYSEVIQTETYESRPIRCSHVEFPPLSLQHFHVVQHRLFWGSSHGVDRVLSDASGCHLTFDHIQSFLVLADVVRHVSFGIHGQQIGATGTSKSYDQINSGKHLRWDEDPDNVYVSTAGGGVQRRPLLRVLRVNIGSSFQEKQHDLLVVVNGALMERSESVIVVKIRIGTFVE